MFASVDGFILVLISVPKNWPLPPYSKFESMKEGEQAVLFRLSLSTFELTMDSIPCNCL